MLEIVIKTIFSKAELFLIRNQYKPFVLSKKDLEMGAEGESSDSSG